MLFERRSLNVSLMLHLGLLLVAVFGLPVLLPDKPEPQPMVMTVELLPISAMTNVKPSNEPIKKQMDAPKPPKPVEKVEPKPEPKPQPQEKPEPMEKVFDPNEDPDKEKEEKKEVKKEEDFEKLLNDLKKESEKPDKPAKDEATQKENKTQSDAPYDETQPLSLSEEDALRSAYIPCWSPPIGGMDSSKMLVVVRARYNVDGSLIDVKLDEGQQGRYNSDSFFRAAAEASLRAVRHPRCNPLTTVPASIFPKLKDTKITFDPSKMGL